MEFFPGLRAKFCRSVGENKVPRTGNFDSMPPRFITVSGTRYKKVLFLLGEATHLVQTTGRWVFFFMSERNQRRRWPSRIALLAGFMRGYRDFIHLPGAYFM